VFTRLYPAPDLVICLDAPGQVLFDRKGEGTVLELERRRRGYLRMGERFARFERVDATLPFEEVYDQVATRILRFHGERARLRRGRALARWLEARTARFRAAVDTVRTRFLCKAMDAALTSGRHPSGLDAAEPVAALPRPRSGYERVRGLVRAAACAVPGGAEHIRRALLKPEALPFDATAEPIAFGSGSTVFRLGHSQGAAPRVLKVYRRTLGQPPDALQQLARQFRAKYATMLRWYGRADFVVPTYFIILHSPLRGYAAVACVQPYLDLGRTSWPTRTRKSSRSSPRTRG
jgi:hypothetical protein